MNHPQHQTDAGAGVADRPWRLHPDPQVRASWDTWYERMGQDELEDVLLPTDAEPGDPATETTGAETILRAGVDLGRWISVEEQMPKEYDTVLIYYLNPENSRPRITLGRLRGYRGAKWHDLTNDEGIGDDPDNVTHWRELPLPPAPPNPSPAE